MKYDLEKIKEELDTLPSYDVQLYLQGDTKDMDSHEAIRNYLLVCLLYTSPSPRD